MTARILALVNGLGLGNSTRCHAIIAALADRGATVEVVTSDNGLWYFEDKPDIGRPTAMPSLHYGASGGRISILRTLADAAGMWKTLRAADRVVAAAIARFRPDAVVCDSVYALGAVRRAGLPLIAINNADMVMEGLTTFSDRPLSILPQGMVVEGADHLYHRIVPDRVISPRLVPPARPYAGQILPVGPIVRRECRPEAPPAAGARPRRVVIMLSGSVFGSPVLLREPHPDLIIDVVGRPAPAGLSSPSGQFPSGPIGGGVTYHGKTRRSLDLIRKADLLIVNGGFSAVSEAFVMRKPMVVIPVPRHAEQWVNGRTVRHLGVGITAAERELEAAMAEALDGIERYRDAYRSLPEPRDGAAEAAEAILDAAGYGA